MKKIYIFKCLIFVQTFGLAQNSIESNPSGNNALIKVVGVGTGSVHSRKNAIYATTGTALINSDLAAVTGYASNSGTLNIGLFGFADGPNSQNNYGIYGTSRVLNGGGVGVMGTSSLSGIGGDNATGGSFTAFAPIGVNGNANAVGVKAYLTGDGEISNRTGFETHVSGPATSGSYGIIASANNSGSSVTYGGYFSASGTGNGSKYGIYSTATGSGANIAAYLNGKVGIGTGTVSVNEILEINGRLRLRKDTFTSGLWLNNAVNGTAITDGAFIGLSNDVAGSEKVGFWLNGNYRWEVDRAGNAILDGGLNIGGRLVSPGGLSVGGGETIVKIMKKVASYDLTSLNPGISISAIIAVNGVLIGDNIIFNTSQSIGFLGIKNCNVNLDGFITIVFENSGGSTIDLPLMDYIFTIYR
ncbi:MAG: hypothetical protein K9I84_00840 [Leadbetterella sp.]|jgi:hypothetical protein|nr:hypothetical protein [Leadbetterella sp.]